MIPTLQLGQFGRAIVSRELWTPKDLPVPPVIWLNDDSGVTDAGAGACGQWNDISGNAVHFSRAANRPLIVTNAINGRRVIRFNGTNNYLENGLGGTQVFRNVAAAWAATVYYRPADGGNAYRPVLDSSIGTSTESPRFALYAGSGFSGNGNKPYIAGQRLDSDSVAFTLNTTASGNVMSMGAADYANRSLTLYVNGAQTAQATGLWTGGGNTSNTASASELRLGGDIGTVTTAFSGDIAEVVVGAASLPSAGDIDRIFGYLAWRWGMQSNLDVSHPYKNSPPLK